MIESNGQAIGLLAGWGKLPIVVATKLKRAGCRVVCCGIRRHADPVLAEICDEFRWVCVTRFGSQIRFFRNHEARSATMAGKIFKTYLFEKFGWLRNFPDLTFWRYYYPHFIGKTKNRNDDSLLSEAVTLFGDHGIRFAPATDFAPELLVKNQTLTRRKLTDYQWRDVQFAWRLAKEMGRLDVGQTVAVKGRAVIAIEAVEGTDQCIERAGSLCSAGNFTVVKVAKPNQDMRFDVPTIGMGTLQTLKKAGGSVLAVEAGKTIMLDQQEMIDFANANGITMVALDSADLNQLQSAA